MFVSIELINLLIAKVQPVEALSSPEFFEIAASRQFQKILGFITAQSAVICALAI